MGMNGESKTDHKASPDVALLPPGSGLLFGRLSRRHLHCSSVWPTPELIKLSKSLKTWAVSFLLIIMKWLAREAALSISACCFKRRFSEQSQSIPTEVEWEKTKEDAGCSTHAGLSPDPFTRSPFVLFPPQSVNFWYVLVMNDEHTERRQLPFLLLGWGLPALAGVLLVAVLRGLRRQSMRQIYGLVHGDL